MAQPFLAEIRVFSFNFAPRSWALCNGQLLNINQNQALFSLLGTTYGGDGRVTFALPNLQGRVSMGVGNGHTMGESAGEEAHTIIQSEMPTHAHLLNASSGLGNLTNPVGNYPAAATENPYATVPAANPTYLSPTTVSLTGGNQSHENRSPFLTLNFCISLVGIFPSQN